MNAPPRFATPRNPLRPTIGGAQRELADALGTPYMPWQRHVADVAGEIDPATGRMAYSLVVLSIQRQAGKTTLLRSTGVHTALQNDGRAWYTAQTRNDARDNWMEAVTQVERSILGEAVKTRLTNGSESLGVPVTGGFFRVFAPMPDALHGKQSDRVFVDECWAFSRERGKELMQAIVPTQATRKAPQVWLVSTAGTDDSTWLKDTIERARAGGEGIAFFDWGIGDDVDPEDLDAVCAAHPAYGHTITREAIEAAYSTMDSEEFARAYGNRWTTALRRIIDRRAWSELVAGTTDTIAASSPVAFGVDLAPNRSVASIAVCGGSVFGRPIVEMVAHLDGVGWVQERLRELVAKHDPVAVVVDPVGPAAALVDAIRTSDDERDEPVRARLVTTGPRSLTAGTLRLFDAIHEPKTPPVLGIRRHDALDAAADSVGRRSLGGGWTWDRNGASPISPLMAVTLAWWGFDHPSELPAPVQEPAIY